MPVSCQTEWPLSDQLSLDIVALGNSGGGMILLGIESGTDAIIGVDLARQGIAIEVRLDEIVQQVGGGETVQRVLINHDDIETIPSGKCVLAVIVAPSWSPQFIRQGEYYVWDKGTSRVASPDEVHRLYGRWRRRGFLRANLRVIFGFHGPITDSVFSSPWWFRSWRTGARWIRQLVREAGWFIGQQWFLHVLCVIAAIVAVLNGWIVKPDILITTSATLAGLASIAIAMITLMGANLQGYVRWTAMLINDTAVVLSLTLNLAVIVLGVMNLPERWVTMAAVVAWIQLFRSVFVAMKLFGPDSSLIARIKAYVTEHFGESLVKFEKRSYPMGMPQVSTRSPWWLRIRLAQADMFEDCTDSNQLWKRLLPSEDGTTFKVQLSGGGDDVAIRYINEYLRNKVFSVSTAHSSDLRQIENNSKWFSEAAAIAAKQQRWSDFEELVDGYMDLTRKAALLLEPASGQSNQYAVNIITYSWNAPTEAMEYAISMAPLGQAQKSCVKLGDMLSAMALSEQSVRDYIDLLVVPSVRALLFHRDLGDLHDIGERLADAIYHALLRYFSDDMVMTVFFSSTGVIRVVIEMIRLLQAQFVGNELLYRQRIGLGILNKFVSVHTAHRFGEVTWSELHFEEHVRAFLEVGSWDKLMGLTPEQPPYLALLPEIQNYVKEILEGTTVFSAN